jgi:hypothetical protein
VRLTVEGKGSMNCFGVTGLRDVCCTPSFNQDIYHYKTDDPFQSLL